MKALEIFMRICVVTTLIGGVIFVAGVVGLLIGVIITEILDKRG